LRLRFKFWIITIAALLAVVFTLSLGRWQLSRADQKESYQASTESQGRLPAVDAQTLLATVDTKSLVHRKIVLRGHWLAPHTVYLDNRQMNDKVGQFVLTPFQMEGAGAGAVLLVQRGWVARNFLDRMQVTPIITPSGTVELEGRIVPPPSKLYELGEAEKTVLRQNVDLAAFSVEIGRPLLAVSVQQSGVASEGLLREWPKVASGVEKHYGYAFQWFALSALISILYVWFQIVRRFKKSQQA
jgi:surfeit locus 1 family protein